jgi:hypothetical protein
MKTLRPLVFTALAASFFISCKKESTEQDAALSNGTQLVKVLTTSEFGTESTALRYDNTDRLSAIEYGALESAYKYTIELGYGADGLLSTSSETQFNAQTNISRTTVAYALTYDTVSRTVRKRITYQLPGDPYYNHTYAFDTQGRIVADTTFNAQTGAVTQYRKLEWDETGNVRQVDNYYTTNNGTIVHDIWQMTYDDRRSPYGNTATRLALFMTYDAREYYLSGNNTIDQKWNGALAGTFDQYVYNADGLPVKSSYRHVVSGNTMSRHEFFYQDPARPH